MTRFIGHRIVYFGVFVVSLTRVIAYWPLFGGPYESSGPMYLTDNGQVMWLYVTLWAVGAILSLFGIIRGKGYVGVLWFVFLMLTWAAGYFGAWWQDGFTGRAWMSVALYGGNGAVSLGVFYLTREIADWQAQANTDTHTMLVQEADE